MAWYHGVWEWARSLLRRGTVEREMEDEFRFHIERETAKNRARGMSAANARRAALLAFGGVERFKEEVREVRGRLLDDLAQDIRIGLRGLRKSPGFTAVALISMALGVGANSAIFSVVRGVLLEPLPYADADRLVQVRIDWPTFDGPLSNADFLTWSETSGRFAAIGAFAPRYGGFTLEGDEPAILEGASVSRTLPATLGVSPILGRLFVPGDESVALVSQRFWRRGWARRRRRWGAPWKSTACN